MYLQDHTGRDIATSIGSLSVDTSNLMKDTTGQNINTTLGQIKDVISRTPTYLYQRKTSTEALSVPDSTHTVIMQLTLTPGIWLISATVVTPNAGGYRQVYVANAPDSTSAANTLITWLSAVSGSNTCVPLSGVIELTETTTLYLKFRQNSGGALNAYGIFNAVLVN